MLRPPTMLAYFEIGLGGERYERVVQTRDSVVIEQQAHAHATLGRSLQFGQQQHPGGVVLPDVVLGVDRKFGMTRQQHPRSKRGKGVSQRAQSIQTRMLDHA